MLEFDRHTTRFAGIPDRVSTPRDHERAASAARNAFIGLIVDCYGSRPANADEFVANMRIGSQRFDGHEADFVGEYGEALEAGYGLLEEATREQLLPDEAHDLGGFLGGLEPRLSLTGPAIICAATRYAVVLEGERSSGVWN